ncbi:MAG: hypothetical protein ACSHXL_00230 [Bacteroidota bacterium]
MLILLKSWSGRSLRLVLWLSVWIGLVSLAGCGASPLSLLTGGGPNVAANTQIGKENNQTVGAVNNTRPKLRVEAPVDTVIQDTSTTKNTEVDPLMLILLILGWLAPSPSEIGRNFINLFKRKQ